MAVPPDLGKMLNMLHGAPDFVWYENGTVKKPELLLPEAGVCMLAAVTVFKDGYEMPSVVAVDAEFGDLHANYWLFDGRWVDSTDRLDRERAAEGHDVFPYKWRTAKVPFPIEAPRRPPLP